jgi:hypothetical protein
MNQRNNEQQHSYVDPGQPDPREIICLILVLVGIAFGLYLFILTWYSWGMYWAFGVLCGVAGIIGGVALYRTISSHRMKVKQHKQEMADRTLKRELSKQALKQDYSVEWEVSDGVSTQRVVLTSPFTIPQGPITQIYADEEEEE